MRRVAVAALIIFAGCKDSTDVQTLAGSYKLAAANGLDIPAEIERFETAQNTHVTRILDGAIQFRSSDSALFLIDTESVAYDKSSGAELALARSCSITPVAYSIAGDRLHLDYEISTPPSQGGFVASMHDTLAISSRRLEGNHKFTWGIAALLNRTVFLAFTPASAAMVCPPMPATQSGKPAPPR
jgi:hypothetical protein